MRRALRLCAIAYVGLAGICLIANWVPWLALAQAPASQLAAIGLVLAMWHALMRRGGGALIVLLASGVFWLLIAPILRHAPEAPASANAVSIRIVLLQNSNAAMVNLVRSAAPQIIAIADASAPERDRLSELADDYPVRLSGGPGGPIILARPPVRLEMATVAPGSASPALLRARVDFDGASFDLAVAHLGRPWPLGAWSQVDATRNLAAGLSGPTDRLVVVGDFNRTPWMPDMRTLRNSLGLSVRRAPGTWPAAMMSPLRLPIDLVLVGHGLGATAISLGPPVGSSHLPLLAEIALRP